MTVAGFVFCKGEAMRRKNREKNQVGLRKRKAERWEKTKMWGSYVKDQNGDREKLLINKYYLYKVCNSPVSSSLMRYISDLIQML